MNENNPYLTINEIAQLFNVRAILICYWEKRGLIKSCRFNPKGKKLFAKKEILKLINNKHPALNDVKLLENCENSEIGTKAKNIKIIKERGGCLIPKTLVITTNVFNELLIDNKISDPLNYDWRKFQIPIKYQKIIFEKINQEFDNKSLVIRSSATCEDSPLLSFAGQYSSFLNIKGKKNIMKAIKLCYRSLFNDNAKIYAKMNSDRLEYESMAIAVQELAPVIVAGVIFTVDPVNQDNKKMIIEYTEGLGDSIVSGHKKPILKIINRTQISNLQKIFLKKLSKTALNLEKIFGAPQDIEWGWDGQEIYIFQSRNITTLDKHPKSINYSTDKSKIIGRGIIACRGTAKGPLKIIDSIENYDRIKKGDIAFIKYKADIRLIKKIPFINALIINGGVLSHLAVIAREFNIPCLIEPKIGSKQLENLANKNIILDCFNGKMLIL